MSKVREIFFKVIDLEPAEQAAFLDGACGGDHALRAEVEELLSSMEEAGDFLDTPLLGTSAGTAPVRSLGTVRAGDNDPLPHPKNEPSTAHLPEVPGYELLAEIGRGGMGVVYRARQIAADRLVALKTVLPSQDDTARERFQREAESIARLQHPGIVQIFEVGETDEGPYFSLELCPHGNLDQYLGGQPISADEAAHLLEALARGVDFAHNHGVVHRDLKPGNVLLAERVDSFERPSSSPEEKRPLSAFLPKVTDFGLARRSGDEKLTQTGTLLGTPSYMAPEQLDPNAEVGPPADVYSLGALLYECLTGRPPFLASTPLQTALMVNHEEPVSPRLLQPTVPRSLDTICLKCIQKDPTRRYPDAGELADDLNRYVTGKPITARPAGTVERLYKWARREPTLAALLGLAVLTVFLLSGAAVWVARLETNQLRAEQTELLRQQRNRDEVESLLEDVRVALKGYDGGALDRAMELLDSRLEEGGAEEFRTEVEGYRAEQRMFHALQAFAQARWSLGLGEVSSSELVTPQDYEHLRSAFESYGIHSGATPPEESARLVNQSLLRDRLLMALEYSLSNVDDDPNLREILSAADPDEFRDQVRTLGYREAVSEWEAAKGSVPRVQPVWFAVAWNTAIPTFAEREQFLRGVHQKHPNNLDILMALCARSNGASGFELRRSAERRVGWCRAGLSLAPHLPELWNRLGVSLTDSGEVDEAITAFRQALARNPKYLLVRRNLGLLLSKKRHHEEAVRVLKKSVEMDPDSVLDQDALAYAYMLAGEYAPAIRHAERTLELDPHHIRGHYVLARILSLQGDQERAGRECLVAIEVGSKDALVYRGLGDVLKALGRIDDAIDCYKRAILLDPTNSDGHLGLGTILCDQQQNYEGARECFAQSLELSPQDPHAHFCLGNARMGLGDLPGAIACYETAKTLGGEEPFALELMIGLCRWRMGDVDRATRHYAEAVRLNPKHVTSRRNLTIALHRQGDYLEATESARELIKIAGDDARSHALLWQVLDARGMVEDARKALAIAVRLDPRLKQDPRIKAALERASPAPSEESIHMRPE